MVQIFTLPGLAKPNRALQADFFRFSKNKKLFLENKKTTLFVYLLRANDMQTNLIFWPLPPVGGFVWFFHGLALHYCHVVVAKKETNYKNWMKSLLLLKAEFVSWEGVDTLLYLIRFHFEESKLRQICTFNQRKKWSCFPVQKHALPTVQM